MSFYNKHGEMTNKNKVMFYISYFTTLFHNIFWSMNKYLSFTRIGEFWFNIKYILELMIS